jgi:hypothetical protein
MVMGNVEVRFCRMNGQTHGKQNDRQAEFVVIDVQQLIVEGRRWPFARYSRTFNF